jgi:hypothetical protein
MKASAKIIILKLQQPLAQLPALATELGSFETVIRIPDSVFVVRTNLTVNEVCASLSALIGERGSVFVGSVSAPCKLHGSDVSLNQVMALVSQPTEVG